MYECMCVEEGGCMSVCVLRRKGVCVCECECVRIVCMNACRSI